MKKATALILSLSMMTSSLVAEMTIEEKIEAAKKASQGDTVPKAKSSGASGAGGIDVVIGLVGVAAAAAAVAEAQKEEEVTNSGSSSSTYGPYLGADIFHNISSSTVSAEVTKRNNASSNLRYGSRSVSASTNCSDVEAQACKNYSQSWGGSGHYIIYSNYK